MLETVWDVDDPFDQLRGSQGANDVVNANLVDPNGAAGGDNRGAGGMGTVAGMTDKNGQARVTMSVSMQPGDNYRAAATLLGGTLLSSAPVEAMANSLSVKLVNGKYLKNGGFQGYKCPVVWSKMLTVWRKLTLEVDSMNAESQVQGDRESNDFEWGRFVVPPASGDIPQPIQVNVPAQGFTTLLGYMVPGPVPCSTAYVNRWEGGALVPPGSSSEYLVVRNSCALIGGQTLSKFILWGNPGNLTEMTSVIRDDDPYFTGGAPQQLPMTTVVSDDIRKAYRDAYVEIIEASTGANPNTTVLWQSNYSWFDLTTDYMAGAGTCSKRDLTSAGDFWVRHVVVCYQPEASEDTDPDAYENCGISTNCWSAPYPTGPLSNLQQSMDQGQKKGLSIRSALRSTATSTVYKETLRDVNLLMASQFWQIVAHEVGHFPLPEQSETQDHEEGGLMSEGTDLQDIPEMHSFTAVTLKRFRGVTKW